MSDWSAPPTLSTLYTAVLAALTGRDDELAKGMDPAIVTVTNPLTNTLRWNSVSNKWQKYNGSTWVDMASTYAITISGNAGNVSGVVAAANGGTGISLYAVGDILYASGTTALSKLAAQAAGKVLLSGTSAPSWGQVPLTSHVSGILPGANGGTNNGFMQFSGPAGSLRTFTLPSASCNILTDNALVSVAQGGTGVNTSTGSGKTVLSDSPTLKNVDNTDQTLSWTAGGTTSWDMNSGSIATLSAAGAGGNTTMGAPTNLKKGVYILHFIQGATARTITWNAAFKWPGGTAPVLSTTSGYRDIFTFVSDGSNLYGTYTPGYTS